MKTSERLTSSQLIMAACGALVVGSVMLSHQNKFGFVLLALAVACGVGAFARSKIS